MSGEDRHAAHVEAGVWNEVCVPCGETDELCRRVESADEGEAVKIMIALPVEKQLEVVRRLEQRNQAAREAIERAPALPPPEGSPE